MLPLRVTSPVPRVPWFRLATSSATINKRKMFDPEITKMMSRRAFLSRSSSGLGLYALTSLLQRQAEAAVGSNAHRAALTALHHPPKAKRVIYLFQSGAPSHIDLFDPKPNLRELTGTELPKSVRG